MLLGKQRAETNVDLCFPATRGAVTRQQQVNTRDLLVMKRTSPDQDVPLD